MKPQLNEIWIGTAGTKVKVKEVSQGKVTYNYVKDSDQYGNGEQRMGVQLFTKRGN